MEQGPRPGKQVGSPKMSSILEDRLAGGWEARVTEGPHRPSPPLASLPAAGSVSKARNTSEVGFCA